MIIDYLSLSFQHITYDHHAKNLLSDDWLTIFGTGKRGGGRAPYYRSYVFEGVTVFEGNGGLLYEFTGKGCRSLYQHKNLFSWFLENGKPTRIDIAIDYAYKTLADIVADAPYNSHILSATGETYYFGSPKSDLFVRCYKYAPPHDRCNAPRAEFVFRRDYAVKLKEAILAGDNDAIVATLVKKAKRIGINLNLDSAIDTSQSLKLGARMDKGLAGTQAWLKKQVAPAIQKLIEAGYHKEDILTWLQM